MNGKMVGGKPLYVALAQRKEERRAKLQVVLPTIDKQPPTGTYVFFVSCPYVSFSGSVFSNETCFYPWCGPSNANISR